MFMKTYIITGASKGLGAAIAEQCFNEGNHCILISRTNNSELEQKARQKGTKITYIAADLKETEKLEALMDIVFSEVNNTKELYLINNAGIVNPIKPAGFLEQEKMELSMKVNFLAPVILSNSFINRTRNLDIKKIIVNISSGAAKNPYHGWSAYCSTKAGLEMFTRTAALEQTGEPNPTVLISFSPGIMDTEMQADIREADEKDFAESSRFKDYKESGMLRTPALVAEKVMDLLQWTQLQNGKFYDIKEML
ncbi:hypothetical protein/benzil reductase ((S)-benzoin forming) [Bacillus sp. OV322]|nr:hypothetical protein/benzil reductase ((S)-benzoin forming) [Bacillus sp. OV322]